jgi:hypothetical protein
MKSPRVFRFTIQRFRIMTVEFIVASYAVQRWGLRCHWDLLQIGKSERTFKSMIYSKLSLDILDIFPLWSRF